jgi:hypothetical protein
MGHGEMFLQKPPQVLVSLPRSTRVLQGLFCWVLGQGEGVLFLQKLPQVLGVPSLIANEGYFDGSWVWARV